MTGKKQFRAAVLAVHGIGNQRPMETVTGIFEALWGADDIGRGHAKRFWKHQEKGVDDIDLMVITTSKLPEFNRNFDFHELYWAHLMSETRAFAVLEWLFDLVRSGPNLKEGMKAFWWGASTYLAFVLLSVVYLGVVFVVRFSKIDGESQILVFLPLIFFWIVSAYGTIASLVRGAKRLSKALSCILLAASIGLGISYGWAAPETAWYATELFLPATIAFLAAFALMGRNGCVAMGAAFALSWGILLLAMGLMLGWRVYFDASGQGVLLNLEAAQRNFLGILHDHALPWQINNVWSVVGASVIVLTYFVLNATFLEPYLGDAARYFSKAPGNVGARREIRRQAVKTLEGLHLSGNYDRIVVVAHSLGTVVAYDMLRAYFSDIARNIPVPGSADDGDLEFDALDYGSRDPEALPGKGRHLIETIARLVSPADGQKPDGKRAWLVTDFVTLGSPLAHGPYLLLRNTAGAEPYSAFRERVVQREYPVCPPVKSDDDGLLTFRHPSGSRYFHHGALFGLTRWTNLYFPLSELFWGDAIGGAVGFDQQERELFGPGVVDKAISLKVDGRADFFTHTAYWDTTISDNGVSPHIEALRTAANLAEPAPAFPSESAARQPASV